MEGLPGWHLEVRALDGKSGEWGRAGGLAEERVQKAGWARSTGLEAM